MTTEIKAEISKRKKARKVQEQRKATNSARFAALISAPIITVPSSPLLAGLGRA